MSFPAMSSNIQNTLLSSSFSLTPECLRYPMRSFRRSDFPVCVYVKRELFEWQVSIVGCRDVGEAGVAFNVCPRKSAVYVVPAFKVSIQYIPYRAETPGPRRPSQRVRYNARTPRIEAMQPNTTVPISPGLH